MKHLSRLDSTAVVVPAIFWIFALSSLTSIMCCGEVVSLAERPDSSFESTFGNDASHRFVIYSTSAGNVPFRNRAVSLDANDISGIHEELGSVGYSDSQMDVDAFIQNNLLGRGINLANALEAPVEGEWGITLQEAYFQKIAEAGFNSVRVPIRWSAHAEWVPPYSIDSDFFSRIDWVVEQSLSRNLVTVVNMHHYEEIMEWPLQHKERFLALWDQIAHRYGHFPNNLFFELLNEPNNNLTPEIWNSFLNETIDVIRQTNPHRTIIIGTALWGDITALNELDLPEDDRNIIVTVHYYRPFDFTHQGAEWIEGSNLWLPTMWQKTKSSVGTIRDDFNEVLSWSESNNRPIYVGEFGAYSKADEASRFQWTETVARQAERKGFSWAYWEFGAGFGVYHSRYEDWDYSILSALIE